MSYTLPASIEAYRSKTDAILEWTQEWLSQDDFDNLVCIKWPDMPQAVMNYTPDTAILSLHSDHQDFLALLQYLMVLNLVEGEERNGKIWYRATRA